MAKKYNVLWIDDEHAKMGGFKLQAAQNDIVLNSFKSRNAGIAELVKNYPLYDAILFDAKFFEDEDDAAGSEDLGALNKAKESLLQLPKKFEMFVLTGQAQLFDDKTFNTFVPKYFRKGIAEDINNLFAELKQSADNLPETQLKHKYNLVLGTCCDKYIGAKQINRLLALIKHAENIELLNNTEDMLTPLRKIVESMFTQLGELSIIPENIVRNVGWINGCSLFLSNKHSGYKHSVEFIHPLASENLYRLLNIIQDASHGEGTLKLKVDKYLISAKSDYFYRSCIFLLFDILLWFKELVDNHPEPSENKKFWREIQLITEGEWISGQVIRIAENGYGTFQPMNSGGTITIIPSKVREFNLSENQSIEIIVQMEGSKKLIQSIRTI
jgi:hypothetical protein